MACLLALEHGFIPGTLNCSEPDANCGPQLALDNEDRAPRLALVDDQPGVTRDRRVAFGRLGDLDLELIDTNEAANLLGRTPRHVRRLAADLDLGTEIVGCPTVREADGLALSSRNRRLSAEDRARAVALPAIMRVAASALAAGCPADTVLPGARAAILAGGFTEVEYLTLRRESDLEPLATASEPARLLAAAWIGGVRLIDNLPVAPG